MHEPLTPSQISEVSNTFNKTKHSALFVAEEEKRICSAILANERRLGVDRSTENVGVAGDLVGYEFMSMGSTHMNIVAQQQRSMMELLLSLTQPAKCLFAGSATLFPYNFLELFPEIVFYVLNDENLYRAENFYLKRETLFNVISLTDYNTATLPLGIDCMILSGPELHANQNPNIIEELYATLPSGGTMIIHESNDYMVLYSEQYSNPAAVTHKKLESLVGNRIYHIPLSLSITVVTKD